MKAKSIPMSLVATHPNQSLAPEDYLPSKRRVKELLMKDTPNSRAILRWMLDNNILTELDFRAYVSEMVLKYLNPAIERGKTLTETMEKVLKGDGNGN